MKLALDIKESSQAIGVGTTNLRKMCRDKTLPSYKEGKKIMIPVKALEDWVSKQVGSEWKQTNWKNIKHKKKKLMLLKD